MNVAKIKEVYFYSGYNNQDALNSDEFKKYLDKENVKYTNLNYGDSSQHSGVFDALNTWSFTNFNGKITEMPFVIWKTFDSDFNVYQEIALTLDELKVSTLGKNLDKVG